VAKARVEKSRPQGEPQSEAQGRSASKGKAQPPSQGPLALAKERLARGDVRGARKVLRGALEPASGLAREADKAEAKALLSRIGVDPGALSAIGGVLAVILFALVTAILLRR
jgi:hypothetical protein